MDIDFILAVIMLVLGTYFMYLVVGTIAGIIILRYLYKNTFRDIKMNCTFNSPQGTPPNDMGRVKHPRRWFD